MTCYAAPVSSPPEGPRDLLVCLDRQQWCISKTVAVVCPYVPADLKVLKVRELYWGAPTHWWWHDEHSLSVLVVSPSAWGAPGLVLMRPTLLNLRCAHIRLHTSHQNNMQDKWSWQLSPTTIMVATMAQNNHLSMKELGPRVFTWFQQKLLHLSLLRHNARRCCPYGLKSEMNPEFIRLLGGK